MNLWIRLRIQRLRFALWWSELSLAIFLRALVRPFLVLTFGLGFPFILLELARGLWPDEIGRLIAQAGELMRGEKPDTALEWRAAAPFFLAIVGLPAAFVIWALRDHHSRGTLENQRKDVNLKEFQEIQARAAGAMDEKLSPQSRDTLQIAALHQLRTFMRGDYGKSFRRPAFEVLRARLVASAEVTKTQAIRDFVTNWEAMRVNQTGLENTLDPLRLCEEIRGALNRLDRSAIADAEQAILSEECRSIFRAKLRFPIANTCFDRITLPAGALLARLRLRQSSFVGAELHKAHLEGTDLYQAHLEGANLSGAFLEGADLREAHLEGADLRGARLKGADLKGAHLECADLRDAFLERADLRGAHLDGANLRLANLESANLGQASLRGADLSWAHLDGADLRKADLDGACLRLARLWGTNLSSVRLCGANLRGVGLKATWFEAVFDDGTKMAGDGHSNDPENLEKRADIITRLRAGGARHVDDPAGQI